MTYSLYSNKKPKSDRDPRRPGATRRMMQPSNAEQIELNEGEHPSGNQAASRYKAQDEGEDDHFSEVRK